jgi:tRNA(Ile)-lysidine synthase
VRRFLIGNVPPPDGTLLVAVSGGPDSVCLLHVLAALRGELGVRLHVAHLDHQLRGAESEADAGYVADLARQLDVPSTIERRNVDAYRAGRRLSVEAAAREVRYDFLAETARAVAAYAVAVGHTRNDHAETVLLHLIRGSGTRGLRGLQPVSRRRISGEDLVVLRPLLEVSREATGEYCRCHGLNPRADATNLSMSSRRNRVRHRLLPHLAEFNPGILDALVRTAGIVAQDMDWLDAETARVWQGVARREGEAVVLDAAALGDLPVGAQRNLLRMAVCELAGDLTDMESRHVDEMLAALRLPAGRRIGLPGGFWLVVDYGRYLLGRDPAALCPFPEITGEVQLPVPGRTSLPGWDVSADLVEPGQVPDEFEALTAYLDIGGVSGALTVRSRRSGDSFQPLGMGGAKKLGRFMIDAHVPRDWRDRIPVVCIGDSIAWLVGYRIDDGFRVTAATTRVLRLEFVRRTAADVVQGR